MNSLFLTRYSFLFKAFFDLLFEILAIMMYCLPNVSQFYEVGKLLKWKINREWKLLLSADHVPPAAALSAASDTHRPHWLRVHHHSRGLRALHHRPRPLHSDQGDCNIYCVLSLSSSEWNKIYYIQCLTQNIQLFSLMLVCFVLFIPWGPGVRVI